MKPREARNFTGFRIQTLSHTKDSNLIKYNPKHQVKVGGKMSSKDAGTVGKMLAAAVLILTLGLATAAVMWGWQFVR